MTMYGVPCSTPKSMTAVIAGWFTLPATRASRVKRARLSGEAMARGESTFTAMVFSSPRWVARKTVPMPPLPSSESMR